MSIEVKFRRLRPSATLPAPEATLPARKSGGAAGYDLFAGEACWVGAGETQVIRLGIASEFPPGVVGLIRDRSSLGARGLGVLAGVIDSDYRGEWGVVLCNHGPHPLAFGRGDRLAQVLFLPLADVSVIEAEDLGETARGEGGFGSTGR